MLLDSVSKIRVSTPESLIDTDFEYGLQAVKWETLQLVNNLPTFFSRTGDAVLPVSNVQTRAGLEYVYVTTNGNHGLIDGQPILIQGLKTPYAEGYFTVNKVLTPSNFVYRSALPQLATTIISDPNTTALFPGQYYQGTGLTQSQFQYIHTDSNLPSQLNVNTFYPHGFSNSTTFMITNSVGKRVLNFNGTNVSGSNISITGHNLVDTAQVTYSKNTNASALTGLTDGGTYYVFGTTSNVVRLSAALSPLTAISITAPTGSNHQLITNDDATDGSFYTVASIPTQSNMLLQAPFQILPNVLTFDPANTINLSQSIIEFPYLHKAQTGAQVTYSSGAGTACAGLTSGTTYYVIRRDLYSMQLATTYANALAGTAINMRAGTLGTGTAHTLTFHGIDGEVVGTGTVTLSNGSNLAWGSNINFLSMIRQDENFYVEIPAAASNVYTITSYSSNLFTVGVTLSNTLPVRFNGVATGVTDGNLYYARNISGSNHSLFATWTEANTNTNPVIPTAFTSGTLSTRSYGSVFQTTCSDVLSTSRIKLATNATVTSSNLRVIMHTGIYPFMNGLVLHRAMDGGVELIPSNNDDAQVIRQTRRYFRYQPGKGIQCSLSVNFNAPLDVDYASYNAGTGKVSVTTKRPHRMSTGLTITMDNQVAAYKNSSWTGVYTVTVTSITTFDYTPAVAPTPTVCPGLPVFWVNSWSNSRVRAGLFDDQNGMFFEFDGLNMYAVRRDSVTQISGYSSVTYGSPIVTGVQNTNYLSQITAKSMIVIKGMSYKVAYVQSNTIFYIQPPYRGVSDAFCVISQTTDTRTIQSDWNLDKCDGTGPSGYLLDPRRIQMVYYDYSWYGAGKIRYGFKDTLGDVRYVHQYVHNNQMTSAYFRAGNLPARYEILNIGTPTWVPPLLHWGTSVIMDGRYDDDKAYLFTASGNVLSFGNGDTIAVMCTIPSPFNQLTNVYDPYTRKTVSAYRILTSGFAASNSRYADVQNLRPGTRVTGTNLPTNTFTIGTPQRDNTDPNKAIIYIDKSPTNTNLINTNYTFGETTDIIPPIIPIVSLRMAPSVDTSIGGLLGSRELVNRMQLKLRSCELMTTNDTEIQLILNATNDNKTWAAATSPSLSQLVYHNKNDSIEGGTVIFSYRVPGGVFDSSGKRTSLIQSYDITQLGALGNSIMGGNGVYPDGTDVLTIAAICLEAGGVTATTPYTITGRLTWAENQS